MVIGEEIMKRNYGGGVIEQRGPNTFRIRYFAHGKRISVTMTGTRAEARRKLRELIGHVDTGTHVAPAKMTLAQWAEQWLLLLRRGEANGKRRRGLVSRRTSERYFELLQSYVLPTLGEVPIQELNVNQIDGAYIAMEERGLSPTTVRHTHVALGACLNTAVGTCARTRPAMPTCRLRRTPKSAWRSTPTTCNGSSPASRDRSISPSSSSP
jgi:hypothetical protein